MGFTNPYPASRLTVDSTNSLVTGMQAWFPLTEGTGTSAQCILHPSHTGTLNGGVSWENGERGVVASFDGADDFIETNSNSTVTSFPITVSAWVKSGGSSRDVIFGSYWANGTNRSLQCEIDASGRMYMLCSSTGSYQSSNSVRGATTLSTTEYSHVVFVFEASGGTLYLNGEVESSSGSLFSTLNTPVVNFLIGSEGTASNQSHGFDGNISNVQVWDRAITAAEVATLYHRPWEGTNYGDLWPYSPPAAGSMTLSTDTAASSLMSGCQAWYPLTEGTGTTATCIMGHSAHNGTLDTGVTWETSERGTAAKFDGTNNAKITLGSEPVSGQTISVSAWVYSEETSGVQAIYCSRQSGFPDSKNYLTYNAGGPNFGWDQYQPSGGGTYSGTISDARGRWVHVVATQDATTSKIYVDGELKGSAASETYSSTAGAYYIGYRYSAQVMTGSIQNLRVWDRVLSADEALLLYERPWEGIEYGDTFHYDPPAPASMLPLTSDAINTDQVGWWPLTETDDYASGAADISGNANNGTQYGGVISDTTSQGGSARFDFVDDRFDIGTDFWNDHISSGTDFTINAWFKADATTNDLGIIGSWGFESNFIMWVDVGGSDVSLTCIGTDHGFGITSINEPKVLADQWYMGTLVANNAAGTATVYLNGASSNSVSYTSSVSTITVPFGIGADRGNSAVRIMDGNIQNVRIWSRALTADEIWSIYSNPWLGSNYKLASGSTPLYNYIFRTERFRRLG